jgi:N-acetylmuramoyl-L-alanine amidase
MNWKLHLLLKAELESYGIKVIQTRSAQGKDLGLEERGKASKGCSLVLSVHSNAVGNGVDENTDYPVAIVQLDGKGDALGEKLAECVDAVMQTKQDGRIYKRKGNYGEYYGVLRGAAAVGTMGIILEHGFHTNTRCTNWLLQDSNLAKLAAAEAKVIAEYYGITKKTESNAAVTVYRVQLGAFHNYDNAKAQLAKAKAAGFTDAFIATSNKD